MLSGKQVRVKAVKNRIVPQYIDPKEIQWLRVATSLLEIYNRATGMSREEIDDEIRELFGEQPGQLVHEGLAKLLADRCEFEADSELSPEEVRAQVFQRAATARAEAAQRGEPFDRDAILREVALGLGLTGENLAEQVERGMFADLKSEQRLIHFDNITAEMLLHRYNTALAQAVLLRAVRVEVTIRHEPPPRLRALIRSIKFHRLIAEFDCPAPSMYTIRLDGPLSLFTATQKYGMQLAMFLPSLLNCHEFELRAVVRWGVARKEKLFHLSSRDGLKSHLPDYGSYTPLELRLFAEQFQKSKSDWELRAETAVLPLDRSFWVPDFRLVHRPSGRSILLEILGFWRRVDAEKHYRKLKAAAPEPFLLAVGEQQRMDETDTAELPAEIYRFKRTPLVDEIAKRATQILSEQPS
ncbi:DUF790 family protein [Tuwongella immobilis]|uniref:DUF790 family protein n=1 Tax=Tuwongella immobilis TaxID=692036 RepID=A0A6C2YV66_9BACT|nr:DUF790 family protein [Tuwongella immobilis]VIP04805.1 hypothetical protein : Uncharacterized protein OS=Singulisphaera acidiphila (strain ATCC BAA-1392 / DSM 18658 / VKM B-2454 / MOB10) GN=Sinac_1079 PE=4 SV=1: DUF790 [Tuwongella immobilis]VTS06970.1 hypothetical protein : Uncharacterized protein OS=Singulisphaera acidiphila (strain ATCC BAA-1392 / DSM 18658 / VKM B-2454 / MOB10) GN=Sinac_1079 PE=4 SV=1: DUF790 [Tuwongella immobilis]